MLRLPPSTTLLPYTTLFRSVSRQLPSNDEIAQMVAKMNVTKGEGTAIRGITETIRGGWGDFATFFKKELGFTDADLSRLKGMYLE